MPLMGSLVSFSVFHTTILAHCTTFSVILTTNKVSRAEDLYRCHGCADPGPGRPRPDDGGKRQRCRCYDAQVRGRIAPDPAAYVKSHMGRKRGRPNAAAREGTNR